MATENRPLAIFRLVLWGLVVVAAIAATLIYFLRPAVVDGPGGGNFALVDQRGAPVDQSILVGHPSMLFFGYTHCPDVCPTTMGEMQGWFAALGEEGKALQAYFVTVDPERDTPELLDGYVSWVSDRITGLTGSRQEIDRMLADWAVVAEKVPAADGGYTMNHTASVFLLDKAGRFAGTIAYGEETQSALAKLRRLVANNA